jgi:hypothetical protein
MARKTVINHAPADIILGHVTLRKHQVYGALLGRYFGNADNPTENPAVRESCRSTEPAGKGSVNVVASLSTKVTMGRNATKRIHISKILPSHISEEPDEDLLPEDRLSQYWVEPTKENELKFNVKGSEADKKKILLILDSYKDIFATELTSAKPARVTPMKMEVDYEAFKADKCSREPTRPQSAA